MLMQLARASLWNRKGTVLMTVISLTISIALLLGIDHIRHEAKSSFTSTVSGTDLIVGARSSQLNLLLYSVFRIGNATNNISWQNYQTVKTHPQVAWSIPIALGDSHRGYRVIGTNEDYFKYYQYGEKQPLKLAQGEVFAGVYQAVIGSVVAQKLGYQLGEKITLSHGVGSVSFTQHKDKPFEVVGILAPTGTPVDQSVHIPLQGIEAIHLGWQSGGMPAPGKGISVEQSLSMDLEPKVITAYMLGLKAKMATFVVQRQLNEFKGEPLSAILPGVALAELWQMLSMVENMLLLITALVIVATLVGIVTTLLAGLKAVGAPASTVFLLIELELLLMTLLSIAAAVLVLVAGLWGFREVLASQYGLFISINPWHDQTVWLLSAVLGLTLVLGAIPAFLAYRRALASGLMVRL
jgi:putative ABC transport system permease protein